MCTVYGICVTHLHFSKVKRLPKHKIRVDGICWLICLFVRLLAYLLTVRSYVLQPTCHHNCFSIDVGHLDCNHQFAKGVCALVTLARLLICKHIYACACVCAHYILCLFRNKSTVRWVFRVRWNWAVIIRFLLLLLFLHDFLCWVVVVVSNNKTVCEVPKSRRKEEKEEEHESVTFIQM